MLGKVRFNVFDVRNKTFKGGELTFDGGFRLTIKEEREDTNLFITPGFIDMHTHIYDGGCSLAISPARCGLMSGVHLLVDAGSTGANNYLSFRDYIAHRYKTKIRAFLNISALGLVSGQPYYDMRYVDPELAARCIKDDGGRFIAGVKVLSSVSRVEERGIEPLKIALQAAEMAGCPVMVHLGSGPPYNDEMLPLLRKGDIITHCFHGDKARTDKSNLLWDDEGQPVPSLKDAIERGVILDVGHGSASLFAKVARNAVRTGMQDFIISTDLHSKSINDPVRGLAETMSKFMSFGMSLEEVVYSVTIKPADVLGIKNWGKDLSKDATIFRLRKACDTDKAITDSFGNVIPIKQWIEPVAVIVDGQICDIVPKWKNQSCSLYGK